MKFLALISGGKDSIYTIMQLKKCMHVPVALLYMKSTTTIDSYMYQSVGEELIESIGKCIDLPLHIVETKNRNLNLNLDYKETENDEVEDLFSAIKILKEKYKFEAVSSGAILSNYQKNRIENICDRLDLKSLTPLWNQNQEELLKKMVDDSLNAIIVKIGTPELTKEIVGEDISKLIIKNYKITNMCGEGGEYETIVLDCPIFKKKINILESEVKVHPEEENKNEITFYMKVKNFELIKK
ncbi:putative ATPases of PP-loop superfamily [Spraguea lophii 42_110]|uniref:Diphthine--ammonia ligase n=1 Tax=Spraguea lophii (strain 42_110) TaxID=1358809 RepID=S7XQP8_SPRLO|nr:putative ATPases of PP-loop superfamily [Spraguea lophii 42_110]